MNVVQEKTSLIVTVIVVAFAFGVWNLVTTPEPSCLRCASMDRPLLAAHAIENSTSLIGTDHIDNAAAKSTTTINANPATQTVVDISASSQATPVITPTLEPDSSADPESDTETDDVDVAALEIRLRRGTEEQRYLAFDEAENAQAALSPETVLDALRYDTSERVRARAFEHLESGNESRDQIREFIAIAERDSDPSLQARARQARDRLERLAAVQARADALQQGTQPAPGANGSP